MFPHTVSFTVEQKCDHNTGICNSYYSWIFHLSEQKWEKCYQWWYHVRTKILLNHKLMFVQMEKIQAQMISDVSISGIKLGRRHEMTVIFCVEWFKLTGVGIKRNWAPSQRIFHFSPEICSLLLESCCSDRRRKPIAPCALIQFHIYCVHLEVCITWTAILSNFYVKGQEVIQQRKWKNVSRSLGSLNIINVSIWIPTAPWHLKKHPSLFVRIQICLNSA